MPGPRKKSFNRQLLDLVDQYQKEHGHEPVNPHKLAKWARARGVSAPPVDPVKLLARAFVKAMKKQDITDPQDREVRRWHSVHETDTSGEQQFWWQTIDAADPKFMRASVQQRRLGSVADLLRTKHIQDSYNENNKFGATLPPLNFDFREDIAEAEASGEYPDAPPDDDDDDDGDDDDGEPVPA